jgi:hypothetical protein
LAFLPRGSSFQRTWGQCSQLGTRSAVLGCLVRSVFPPRSPSEILIFYLRLLCWVVVTENHAGAYGASCFRHQILCILPRGTGSGCVGSSVILAAASFTPGLPALSYTAIVPAHPRLNVVTDINSARSMGSGFAVGLRWQGRGGA